MGNCCPEDVLVTAGFAEAPRLSGWFPRPVSVFRSCINSVGHGVVSGAKSGM